MTNCDYGFGPDDGFGGFGHDYPCPGCDTVTQPCFLYLDLAFDYQCRRCGSGWAVQWLHLPTFQEAPQTGPPPGADVTAGIETWGWQGNDRFGSCVCSAFMHYRMTKAGSANLIPPVSNQAAESLYYAFLGDYGLDDGEGIPLTVWLCWLFDKGLIEGFAQVGGDPPIDVSEVRQAVNPFHGVLLTYDPEEHHAEHLSLLVGYDSEGETLIAWNEAHKVKVDWGAVAQAWVIITSAEAARAGVDLAALQTEIRSLPRLPAGHVRERVRTGQSAEQAPLLKASSQG